jgi:hypothetical protein
MCALLVHYMFKGYVASVQCWNVNDFLRQITPHIIIELHPLVAIRQDLPNVRRIYVPQICAGRSWVRWNNILRLLTQQRNELSSLELVYVDPTDFSRLYEHYIRSRPDYVFPSSGTNNALICL